MTALIPRLNGADIVPPAPTYVGTRFAIPLPRPTTPFAGPKRLGDPLARFNPVISDFVFSTGVVVPATVDASAAGNPYKIAPITSNHWGANSFQGSNQGFADGHVELRGPHDVKPQFGANNGLQWNWR